MTKSTRLQIRKDMRLPVQQACATAGQRVAPGPLPRSLKLHHQFGSSSMEKYRQPLKQYCQNI